MDSVWVQAAAWHVVLSVLCVLLWRWCTFRKRHPEEPPVVTGWIPFVGCGLSFGHDSGAFLAKCRRQYGDTFTLYMVGKRLTFFLDPFTYPVIEKQHELSFEDISLDVSSKTFGYSRNSGELLYHSQDNDEDVKNVHSINNATLGGKELPTLMGEMESHLRRVLTSEHRMDGGWQEGKLFDFVQRMQFEASTATLFGEQDFATKDGNASPASILKDFKEFDDKFRYLAAGIPAFFLGRCVEAMKGLSGLFVYNEDETKPKLVGREDASRWTKDRETLFDQLNLNVVDRTRHHMSMIWISQANMVPATFWSLAYILNDKMARIEIAKEIQECLHTFDTDPLKFIESKGLYEGGYMKPMTKLDSAINEALRLTAASITVRKVTKSFLIDLPSGKRYYLHEGDQVSLYPFLTHRDEEIFKDPERYQWDRFLAKKGFPSSTTTTTTTEHAKPPKFYKNGKRLAQPLMPFGGGSSQCPGRYLAHNQIKIFICLLLHHFDVELKEASLPPLDPGRAGLGILHPTNDISFRWKRK